jgi:coenzyme F420-0:L-glutamate ligase/coenzyme F420-1:gamma-L-glutamate ligase
MKSEYIGLMKERRSVRRYTEDEVTLDEIRHLITNGTYAPSAHNSQPWRFVVILRSPLREELVRVMSEAFRRDLTKDGKNPDEIERRVEESKRRMMNASHILLACLSMKDMWRYGDTRDEFEYTMAVQSVAASIQNILLAAHASNIGCCWMCAPLFAKNEVSATLKLPEDYDPQAFVLVGYPDESPEMPRRKPIDDVMLVLE